MWIFPPLLCHPLCCNVDTSKTASVHHGTSSSCFTWLHPRPFLPLRLHGRLQEAHRGQGWRRRHLLQEVDVHVEGARICRVLPAERERAEPWQHWPRGEAGPQRSARQAGRRGDNAYPVQPEPPRHQAGASSAAAGRGREDGVRQPGQVTAFSGLLTN